MEEKYKEVIEIGMALIEEKLMEKFGLSASDIRCLLDEYAKEMWLI